MSSLGKIVVALIVLGLSGCAGTAYRYNLQHAKISESAALSPAEVEQVIAEVTKYSMRLIIGITRFNEEGRDRVIVYTKEPPDEEGMMVYRLEKSSGGLWHIVKYGHRNVMVM